MYSSSHFFDRTSTDFQRFAPILVCMASGRLEAEPFHDFVVQVVTFIEAFLYGCELAEKHLHDDRSILEMSMLKKTVKETIQMHKKEFLINPSTTVNANSATLKYRKFLLEIESGEVEFLENTIEEENILASILSAMVPCMWVFKCQVSSVGSQLSNDNPQKAWAKGSSSSLLETAGWKIDEWLKKVVTRSNIVVLQKIYDRGIIHATLFFSTHPVRQKTVVPLTVLHNADEDRLLLFSDFAFDDSIFGEILTSLNSSLPQNENPSELMSTWGFLATNSELEYANYIKSILPPGPVEFNYEALCEELENLSAFESRANDRVLRSGILRGLNLEDIKRKGEGLLLEDSCRNFFLEIAGNKQLNAEVSLVSYCWCADLIRSAFSSGVFGDISVYANELVFKKSISTGEIRYKVMTPKDKLEVFQSKMRSYADSKKNFSIYVGRNIHELPCLLKADLGIVLGSSKTIDDVSHRFGVSVLPLFSAVVKNQKEFVERSCSSWKTQEGTLYRASSWFEVQALILGWPSTPKESNSGFLSLFEYNKWFGY